MPKANQLNILRIVIAGGKRNVPAGLFLRPWVVGAWAGTHAGCPRTGIKTGS